MSPLKFRPLPRGVVYDISLIEATQLEMHVSDDNKPIVPPCHC